MEPEIDILAGMLHKEKCSCVIFSRGNYICCRERGVKDLLHILRSDKNILSGAMVADKVVGKGAAALMILGGVKEIYADVISRPALRLLYTVSVRVTYGTCVDNIIKRTGTGICPVEKLCRDCDTAIDCLPLIEKFVKEINTSSK